FARKQIILQKIVVWRYADDNNAQKKKIAALADVSCGVDTDRYMDTGATNHITGEL
uniref:Uncharacterized protein n=1 Tax=Aegilops tauschii subsp. strangulata TaxID=200361 RepID=A0A453MVA1_AEGTS